MKSLRLWIIIGLVTFLSSCSYFNKSEKREKPVARVYDKLLYHSDLAGVGNGAVRPEDSIQLVRNYVDSWIRHNLLLKYAEDNLPEQQQTLNEQLRDYKESLLIFLYEKELLNDKLDTVISNNDIAKYYQENKESFELKQAITQLKFIMLRIDTKVQLDSVRVWMKKITPDNYPKLRSFCNEYAVNSAISDSIWYNKEQLEALLPIDKFNLEDAQRNQSYHEVADSGYAYLMKFQSYRNKGTDPPLDLVRNDISDIIINKRKLAFLGSIHKNIYDEALQKDQFEIFVDNTQGAGKVNKR